jgi:hypothetical protein
MTNWPWFDEKMRRGREIVTAAEPDAIDTPEFFEAWAYYREQEKRVAERGCCEACGPSELRACAGRTVCRRTLNVCPKLQLSEIVSLYEKVFE